MKRLAVCLTALVAACAAETERPATEPRPARAQADPASSTVAPARLAPESPAAPVGTFTVLVDRGDGAAFDVVRMDLPPDALEALVDAGAPAGWAIAREWEDSDGFWDRGRLQQGLELRLPPRDSARSVAVTLTVRQPARFLEALSAAARKSGAGTKPRVATHVGSLDERRRLVMVVEEFRWLDLFRQ